MSDIVMLGKFAIACACVAATLLALKWKGYHAWDDHSFLVRAVGFQVLSRLGIFVGLFIVMKVEPQSDVTAYYTWTKHTLAGIVPGRDPAVLPMHYGPLFLYITGAAVWLWDSAKAIVLLLLLCETAAMPFWILAARKLANEQAVRNATVLYLLCPISVINVSISGVNNTGIVLLLGVSVYLATLGRSLSSGLALGLSVIAVKFLSLLQMPILLVTSRRPVLWSSGFFGLIALGYGSFYLLGVDPMVSLRFHAIEHSSSGNLPYLLGLAGLDVGAGTPRLIANVIGMVALGVFFLSPWILRKRRYDELDLMPMIAGVMFLTMLVSKKAFPHYLMIGLFPLCISIAQRGLPRLIMAALFVLGLVTAVESSLWFRWMKLGELSLLTASSLPDGVTHPKVAIFAGVECVLLACYVVFVADAWRQLTIPRSRQESRVA